MKEINGLGKRQLGTRYPPQTQTAEIKGKITTVQRNEMIPAHVWEQLQECGEVAVERMQTLLASKRFDGLRASDQLALIRLALEYSFGKPEVAPKREIKVKLSNVASDAVSIALERLAGIATLPEHSARDTSPDDED